MDLYIFISQNINILFNLFVIFIINITLFFVIQNSNFLLNFSKKKLKKNIQNIHIGEVSRLGGLIIVTATLIASFFYFKKINLDFLTILLCSIPVVLLALLEDLIQNINPFLRLLCLFTSPVLFIFFGLNELPTIDIIFIDEILNIKIISIIFFSICLTGYMNGVNFIDGTNGLATLTILTSLLCLLFLSLTTQDLEIAELILYLIIIVISFLIFNYPFGKIFLGDTGAYFLAFITGTLTILFMVRNPEIPNWSAVSILSYPTIEVIFSFFRKIYNKKNPFYPDRKHLHLKLYFVLQNRINNSTIANSLVAPFLSLIWLMPIVVLPWIYMSKFLIILAIICQIIIYYLFYSFIPEEKMDL